MSKSSCAHLCRHASIHYIIGRLSFCGACACATPRCSSTPGVMVTMVMTTASDALFRPRCRCRVQRSRAIRIGNFDVSTFIEQVAHSAHVSLGACPMQCRLPQPLTTIENKRWLVPHHDLELVHPATHRSIEPSLPLLMRREALFLMILCSPTRPCPCHHAMPCSCKPHARNRGEMYIAIMQGLTCSRSSDTSTARPLSALAEENVASVTGAPLTAAGSML